MKQRTFYKRESRFWHVDNLRVKRWQNYTLIRKDGGWESFSSTDKMDRQWCRARALYHKAYREFYGELPEKALKVRVRLCRKNDKVYAKPIPPGRKTRIVMYER